MESDPAQLPTSPISTTNSGGDSIGTPSSPPDSLSTGPCSSPESSSPSPGLAATGHIFANVPRRLKDSGVEALLAEAAAYERKRAELQSKYSTHPNGAKSGFAGLFNMRSKSSKTRFVTWMKNIPNVEYFTQSEQRMVFYWSLSKGCRRHVRDWLRRISPPLSFRQFSMKSNYFLKDKQRQVNQKMAILGTQETDIVMVQKQELKQPGFSIVQVVPKTGLQKILGSMVVAGETREAIAKMMSMELPDVNRILDNMDLEEQEGMMDRTVIALANNKVMNDLATGKIDDTTKTAESILIGRKKLKVDQSKEVREWRREEKHDTAKKAEDATNRFINVEVVNENPVPK